jgi:hypothetical protein
VRRELLGPRHPETATSLAQLGEAALAAGKPAEAIEPLAEAIEILAGDASAAQPDERAAVLHESRFLLARAWWDADVDRGKARAMAQAARDGLLPGEHAEVRAKIDGWLAEHGEGKARGPAEAWGGSRRD